MPTLRLLGPVLLDGQPLPDERPTHLLVLLAATPGGCTRAQAAATLWPALDAATAGRNLRKTLHRLRSDGHGGLLAAGDRLQLAVPTDWAAAEAAPPADTLALMRGPLADGLRDDTGWLGAARERALALWRRALLAALPSLDGARAEAELERLRALDPHDEPLARAHLQHLHAAGRRDAFQRVRAAFVRALADDLGVAAPADLVEPPAADLALALPPAARATGPLIGREDELAELGAALAVPGAARVLRGPGGIGKTRLAAAAAEQAARDGLTVVWWRLAGVDQVADALARLAAELGVDTVREPLLAAALVARPTLLVADNTEHLLDAGLAAHLRSLRAAAPSLRLLVTSRTSVEGLAEQRVGALDTPDPADPPGAVLRSAAVRLFVARALAVDAALDARSHAPALGRIARAAGGHPLALEMAAARVRHAAPDEIAAALEAGSADLDTFFAAMWQALPETLQPVLATLAALPPRFERALAESAAGLAPARLDALAARSLIERDGSHWRLHPLLRLWLQAQQPRPEAELRALRRRLSAHVAAQLAQRLEREAADAPAMLVWLAEEQALLDLAIRQALADADAAALDVLLAVFSMRFEVAGRWPDAAAELAAMAQAQAGQPAAARAPVQAARAVVHVRLGRWDDARALAALARGAPPRSRVVAARAMGLALWRTHDLAGALRWQRRALALAVDAGLDGMVASCRYNIAVINADFDRLADAELGFQQAAEQARSFGSLAMQARCLVALSMCLYMQGRAAEALPMVQQARAVVERHGLGALALTVGLNEAVQLLALGELDALGQRLPALRSAAAHGEAALRWMAEIVELRWHLRQGRLDAARASARTAWAQVRLLNHPPAGPTLAAAVAELWIAEGRRDRAALWLAWALRLGTLAHDERGAAQALWASLALDAPAAAAAETAALGLDVEQLGAAIG
jgi:DNA-binding SARP family transcriptional activator